MRRDDRGRVVDGGDAARGADAARERGGRLRLRWRGEGAPTGGGEGVDAEGAAPGLARRGRLAAAPAAARRRRRRARRRHWAVGGGS